MSSKRWVRPWAVVAVPLRFFYPQTASPGLSSVVFRPIQTSRLHLPAPLGSTGITRLHRYYECSDSCAWMCVWPARPGTHPLLDAAQVSPLHGSHLPGSPSPITPPLPRSLCHLSCQRRRLPVHHGSGLHLSIGGSPVGTANRVCATTDGPFASRCSPHHLTMTQLRSATERKQVSLKGTFTSLM